MCILSVHVVPKSRLQYTLTQYQVLNLQICCGYGMASDFDPELVLYNHMLVLPLVPKSSCVSVSCFSHAFLKHLVPASQSALWPATRIWLLMPE
jgi:hypothetical protein